MNTNNQKVSTLHRSIVLLEAAQTYYNNHNVFNEILLSQHKNLLKLNQLNSTSDNNSSTSTQEDAAAEVDTATNSSSSSIYIKDCLTLLEWLLLNKNQETKLNALNFLIFGGNNEEDGNSNNTKKGQVLLQLADMINQNQNNNNLEERLRPLKILTEVGKSILEMCMEKRPDAKRFEVAIRPLVSEIAKKTQGCLGDKKRLIRSGAAECRNFWLLIPKQ